MPEQLYTVIPKDCLWDLSQRFYHKATLWPLLFAYNNRPDVVRRTGTVILDPDLILIGQKLMIPDVSALQGNAEQIKRKIGQQREDFQRKGPAQQTQMRRLRQSQPPSGGGSEPMGRGPAKPLAKPAFVVDLGESKIPPIKGPRFSANLKLSGQLLVQSTQSVVGGLSVENLNRVKFRAKNEAETIAGKLVQDIKINFDSRNRKLNLSCGLTTQTNMPNAPEVNLVAGVNTAGQPTLTGCVTYKMVKGTYQQMLLASEEVTFTLELSTDQRELTNPDEEFDWSAALGIAGVVVLTAGAVVIVVGTLAEDVVTLGAGIADDPASFAIAGGMLAASGRLLATHLPKLSPRMATALGLTVASPMTTADKPITEE